MTLQLSTEIRNAQADAIANVVGASPTIKILDGVLPDNVRAPDDGVVLAVLALPDEWLSSADDGVVELVGTWIDISANNDGVATYFRLYDADGACHMQGTISEAGGGGDMLVSDAQIYATQTFTISSFTYARGNA